MNVIEKQYNTSKNFTIGISVLLIIAVCFVSITFSTWVSAQKQVQYIEENYVSIAVPAVRIFDNGYEELVENMRERKEFWKTDERATLTAYIPQLKALTSASEQFNDFNANADTPYNLSVFAVKCVSFTMTYDEESVFWLYTASFLIEDIVCQMNRTNPQATSKPHRIVCNFLYTEDSKINYTGFDLRDINKGKKYLVAGFYKDTENGKIDQNCQEFYILNKTSTGQTATRSFCISEYDGNWRDHIESEYGKIWKEKIIPTIEKGYNTAKLLLTNCVDSIYAFNVADAVITRGRKFTDKEYEQGSNVCLVSEAFADLNNLVIGDNISISVYRAEAGLNERYIVNEDNYLGIEKEFEVVGIYSSQAFESNIFNLNPDNIIIPKNSVVCDYGKTAISADQYMYKSYVSFIVPNGELENLKLYLENSGYGEDFFYNDQGYENAIEGLNSIMSSSLRLIYVGIAVFLLCIVIYIYLSLRKIRPTVRSMRLIGIKPHVIFKQSFKVVMKTNLIGVAAGAVISGVAYKIICTFLTSVQLNLNIIAFALSLAVQFGVITAMTAVALVFGSKIRLMGKK